MSRSEIQDVLEVCATRLEARAAQLRRDHDDTGPAIAYVLRAEAAIIRAGCHVYPEIAVAPAEPPE
jgi:hypothetical protein